jgi:hypothetical protein
MYGDNYSTSAASDTSIFQKFIPTNNIILVALRPKIIQNNNPSWTSANMKIYSYVSGAPRALIATSTNSVTKASISALNSFMAEVPFYFSNLILKGGESYAAVINFSGYTGSDSSHLAWKRSYPDPAYRTNVATTFEGLSTTPFDLICIGDEL